MVDIAELGISVDSRSVRQGTTDLDRIGWQAQATERQTSRATSKMGSAFKRLVLPLTAAVSAAAGLNKLVSVTREFDILNAQLETATGGADKAAQAFEAIQDFASTTPYDLQQATNGFTQLVNLGLTPSERAMRSYGDTASSMGKDLSQMVEAVADATTGEFERLKEFGIKAKTEGDNIKFTFQGVTTSVKNNAEAIEEYLIGIGETSFAGGMERRMATLDGAISNLGDEWDKLFLNISQNDVGGIIESSVRGAIGVLEEANAWLASGQLKAQIEAQAIAFQPWADTARDVMDSITGFLDANVPGWETKVLGFVDAVVDAYRKWPIYLHSALREVAARAQFFFEEIAIRANGAGDAIAAVFTSDTIEAALDRQKAALDELENRRMERLANIELEKNIQIAMFDTQLAKARQLREEYDKAQEARANASEDRLAGFGLDRDSGSGGDGVDSEIQKRLAREAAAREKELEKVRAYLRTEEEEIRHSYERRRQIILSSTQEGTEAQKHLLAKLDLKYITEGAERSAQIANEILGDMSQQTSRATDAILRYGSAKEKSLAAETRQADLIREMNSNLRPELIRQLGSEAAADRLIAKAAMDVVDGASEAAKAAQDMGWAFSSAFEDAIISGGKLSDVMQGLLEDIQRIVVRSMITQPLGNAVGDWASTLFNAHGNAFDQGKVTAFAAGGVVSQPTAFPMARGVGVMGEAGPEAIMPLTRTSGGDLGVKAAGGGTVVQIIDQRSGGERAEVQESRGPNGEKMIRVLIRGEMKSAFNEGAMDRTMADNYGMRRR